MAKIDRPNGALARHVRRLGHLDLPGAGQVMLDARGLIYIVDRHVGFDVLEFTG